MRRSIIAATLAAALSVLAVQVAFAWPDDATASLSSTPTNVAAGQPWVVDISFATGGMVLNVDTIQPVVTIRNVQTGETKRIETQRTKVGGVYEASVVFPSAGTWAYSVTPFGVSGPSFDYPPVAIAPAAAPAPAAPTPGTSGPLPVAAIGLGAVAALAAAIVVAGLLVRRRASALAIGR